MAKEKIIIIIAVHLGVDPFFFLVFFFFLFFTSNHFSFACKSLLFMAPLISATISSIPPYSAYFTQSVEVVGTSKNLLQLGQIYSICNPTPQSTWEPEILDCLPNPHVVDVENETVKFSVKTDYSSSLTYPAFTTVKSNRT